MKRPELLIHVGIYLVSSGLLCSPVVQSFYEIKSSDQAPFNSVYTTGGVQQSQHRFYQPASFDALVNSRFYSWVSLVQELRSVAMCLWVDTSQLIEDIMLSRVTVKQLEAYMDRLLDLSTAADNAVAFSPYVDEALLDRSRYDLDLLLPVLTKLNICLHQLKEKLHPSMTDGALFIMNRIMKKIDFVVNQGR